MISDSILCKFCSAKLAVSRVGLAGAEPICKKCKSFRDSLPQERLSEGTVTPDGPVTQEELSELLVVKKPDFGSVATVRKVGTYARLHGCIDTIKDHLREGFAGWLQAAPSLGMHLSKEDPVLLEVKVVNFKLDTLFSTHKQFDFTGLYLLPSQVERLNNALYDLPLLLKETEPFLKKKRDVIISLRWYGSKNMKFKDVLGDLPPPGTTHH